MGSPRSADGERDPFRPEVMLERQVETSDGIPRRAAQAARRLLERVRRDGLSGYVLFVTREGLEIVAEYPADIESLTIPI